MGNFLSLINGHGEPLWIPEHREAVFNEDNSSSRVEDRGEEGKQAGEASQSPALSSSRGNGDEDERKQRRGRAGSWWCRRDVRACGDPAREDPCQDTMPLATMEMLRKGGHLNGKGRGTLGCFFRLVWFGFLPLTFSQVRRNVPGDKNPWRHHQDAGM